MTAIALAANTSALHCNCSVANCWRNSLTACYCLTDGEALVAAKGKSDALSRWAVQLQQRRGYWRAVVAIAAKNARMAWAVLARGERFVMPV